MSEPIPESIPTSADPRSRRPLKKTRISNPNEPAITSQKFAIDTLFLEPDRPLNLPSVSTVATLAPPPEIVANVQGSSAGAGSGEFHVYKASRRREYERLKVMEEEAEKEEGDQQWEEEKERRAKEDAEKTEKKRRERERKKKRGKGGGGTAKQNVNGSHDGGQDVAGGDTTASMAGTMKKPLQIPRRDDAGLEDDDVGPTAFANGAQTNGHEENGITIHDDD